MIAVQGGDGSSASDTSDTDDDTGFDTSADEEFEPEPEPEPAVPDPVASYDKTCDYLIGEGDEDYDFVAQTDIDNTGNVGLVARVTATWQMTGSDDLAVKKTARVPYNKARVVEFNIPATGEQIDRHQASGDKCSVNVQVIDYFGRAH